MTISNLQTLDSKRKTVGPRPVISITQEIETGGPQMRAVFGDKVSPRLACAT